MDEQNTGWGRHSQATLTGFGTLAHPPGPAFERTTHGRREVTFLERSRCVACPRLRCIYPTDCLFPHRNESREGFLKRRATGT